jgi:hypothetical protein
MDMRRYGVIEVKQINAKTFHLSINGVMWSEVEWSSKRQTWCIQDSEGHCLVHCEHIVGADVDQQTAIAEARAMILDGRMPSPEAAKAASRQRQREFVEKKLGEPMEILQETKKVPVR